MGDSPQNKRPQEEKVAEDASQKQMEKIRCLIVGPTNRRIEEVAGQIEDSKRHANAVSRVLPQSVMMGAERDNRLASALEPVIENTIRTSIQKDRRILVDALSPVMGPAIRKAIASAIQGLIQNFNQILEYSVSTKGLKWRLEAWRTRRPFGEVVLLHTLVYQVEQVFLIHRPSGLLISHVVAKTAVPQNPDLVSGMLTAIKDFVQDSFGATREDTLDTFQVGERKVWIEHGPHAILAAAIRGNPPSDLRSTMSDVLDECHVKGASVLEDFQGDSAVFEPHHHILNGLLQARFRNRKAKPSFKIWIIFALLVVIVGWAGYGKIAEGRRWQIFLEQLIDQPGIVVTLTEKHNDQWHIYGLKDPYAPDLADTIESTGRMPTPVIFHWEAYHSGHTEFARRRVAALFKPPQAINTTFDQGRLAFFGSARYKWIENARCLAGMLPWIVGYTDDQVVDIDARLECPPGVTLELSGSTLQLSGAAPHAWIVRAGAISASLPGVKNFDATRLVDVDVQAWETAVRGVESVVFYFQLGRDTLIEGQTEELQSFIDIVQQLITLSDVLDRKLYINIIGYADPSGERTFNLDISRKRAQAMKHLLIAAGIDGRVISTRGAGYQPTDASTIEADLFGAHRRVGFELSTADQQSEQANSMPTVP